MTARKTVPDPAAAEAPSPRVTPEIRLPVDDSRGRLIRAVFKSPRLTSALPASFDELTSALTAAKAAAEEARRMPVPSDDLADELDATLRAGGSVDVADLLTRVGAAETARAHREAALKLIEGLPLRYKNELIKLVMDAEDALYEKLSADLDALLDAAEAVVARLGSVSTSDEAVDAGLADDWRELRRLADAYKAIRADHASLLHATSDGAGSPEALARLYFAGIDVTVMRTARDLLGQTTTASFDPLSMTSETLLEIVKRRAELSPRIGRPGDDADGSVVISDTFAVPAVRDPATGDLLTTRHRLTRGQEWTVAAARYAGPGRSYTEQERADRL